MARNEEKHAGRLNRLWLERLDEVHALKNPTRPGLGSLRTAEDVKKWMPSIKKDIDFYLKQSQVSCYPERKITEFSEKIEGLAKEYKAYLRKFRDLDGNKGITPWTDQPYTRKHKTLNRPAVKRGSSEEPLENKLGKTSFTPLTVPILEKEEGYKDLYGYNMVCREVNQEIPMVVISNYETEDRPLEFNLKQNLKALEYSDESDKGDVKNQTDVGNKPLEFSCKTVDRSIYTVCDCCVTQRGKDDFSMGIDGRIDSDNSALLRRNIEQVCSCRQGGECGINCPATRSSQGTVCVRRRDCEPLSQVHVELDTTSDNNILNLPYSDSSDDEG